MKIIKVDCKIIKTPADPSSFMVYVQREKELQILLDTFELRKIDSGFDGQTRKEYSIFEISDEMISLFILNHSEFILDIK